MFARLNKVKVNINTMFDVNILDGSNSESERFNS